MCVRAVGSLPRGDEWAAAATFEKRARPFTAGSRHFKHLENSVCHQQHLCCVEALKVKSCIAKWRRAVDQACHQVVPRTLPRFLPFILRPLPAIESSIILLIIFVSLVYGHEKS